MRSIPFAWDTERWGARLAAGPDRRPYGDWGARGVRRSSSLKVRTEVRAGSEGHEKEEAVCESQTRPDDWSAREEPEVPRRASCPCRLSVEIHPLAVRQDLSQWARPDASAGPAGRGTHSRSELPHPTSAPRAAHNSQQLLKKQKSCIFGGFWRLRLAEAARRRPGVDPTVARGAQRHFPMIAQ